MDWDLIFPFIRTPAVFWLPSRSADNIWRIISITRDHWENHLQISPWIDFYWKNPPGYTLSLERHQQKWVSPTFVQKEWGGAINTKL